MTDREFRELSTEAAWREAYPVMVQLRDHLDEEEFLGYVREMAEDGYRLFAAFVDDEIVSVAGVTTLQNMYDGRHAYVYDLVTDADRRSEGHGLALLSFVEDWARERGYDNVVLTSGLQRTDAHRFYEERAEMERASYVYRQSLE
ncbi:MAG TPA: GNAT family N-acetyltransferase [Halobacteriales archaeon]|nr:GNAT family N-acetyltransferase [Halobacteriales archaeon]